MDLINELNFFYGISFIKKVNEIKISGSPERSEERFVLKDYNSNLYVAEKVFLNLKDKKNKISKTLEYLNNKGLKKAVPYLLNKNNKFLTTLNDGSCWQVIKYINGKELNRPGYVFDGWRGRECSDFLFNLKRFSKDIPFFDNKDYFSIKDYIIKFIGVVKYRNIKVYEQLLPVFLFLEKDFFKIHDSLKTGFCHGDFHPVNIIWSKNSINSVIDWEFCGIKHEIYDLSNLVGCLGIELPDSLAGGFVEELFNKLEKFNIYSDLSYKYLLDHIIALRFAWMSEWLRKNDDEMIELELSYMSLLIENYSEINRIWNLV